jgi:hypothetical protein
MPQSVTLLVTANQCRPTLQDALVCITCSNSNSSFLHSCVLHDTAIPRRGFADRAALPPQNNLLGNTSSRLRRHYATRTNWLAIRHGRLHARPQPSINAVKEIRAIARLLVTASHNSRLSLCHTAGSKGNTVELGYNVIKAAEYFLSL